MEERIHFHSKSVAQYISTKFYNPRVGPKRMLLVYHSGCGIVMLFS